MLDEQEKSIERIADKPLDTLFTKPKNFAKEFETTIHQAVLKPVVEGFGSMAASAIRPVIYGEDGKGGIAGVFKGIFGGGKSSDPPLWRAGRAADRRQRRSDREQHAGPRDGSVSRKLGAGNGSGAV